MHAKKVEIVVATLNSATLPFALRDYADQLDQMRRSLTTLAREAGEYKDLVSRMATSVHSASNVMRAASHIINSKESHKEHEANKAERDEAKARRSGR